MEWTTQNCAASLPDWPGWTTKMDVGSSGETAVASRRIHSRLPLFRVDGRGEHLLYTPGVAILLDPDRMDRMEEGLRSGLSDPVLEQPWFRRLLGRTAAVQRSWDELAEADFIAESLTIIPAQRCGLRCGYCYTRGQDARSSPAWGVEAILAVVDPILVTCREKSRRFTLAVHGGGEPTEAGNWLGPVLRSVRRRADEFEVPMTAYLATNGQASTEQAAWIADEFDLVGLSCDGPPAIQDRQRPGPAGGPGSSDAIVRFLQSLHQRNVRIQVRSTITRASMTRQMEVAWYLVEELGLRELRFEPVYGGGRTGFRPAEASEYARHFLLAQEWTRSRGGSLSLSGVRPEELHGAFCEVLRNTYRLMPSGLFTNCFFREQEPAQRVGRFLEGGPDYDGECISRLRRRAFPIPAECRDCFCSYHCSRGCPDACAAKGESPHGSFRCRLNQEVGFDWARKNKKDEEFCDAKG